MKKLLIVMGAALMLASCNSSNVFLQEWDTPYGIPPFDKIKIGDYMPAIKAGIEQQNAEIQAIIDNQEAPSFENTVAAFDRSGALLEKVTNVLFNVSESDYTPELNAIVEEATPVISAHGDNLMMNPKLFERVKAVYEAPQDNLTREQQMLLKDLYEGFVRNGIGLDEAGQARMKEINSELATLALTFGNNLLAQSNAFKDSVGFSVASYYDKMASEADRAQREKIFRLYSNRGNNGDEFDNKATVLRIMELRIEKAKLMGYESPATFILEDKMAHDPATVDAFLGDIMAAAMRRAKEEVADMQKLMDEDVAAGVLPAGSRIEPWDYMYYAEKVRKARYDLDESEVSQYFKMENVRAGVFGNASRLYGIQFEPITGAPLYNPECEAFKVVDFDGSLIVVNVGNFNKPTADKPSLLTIDQVETMFHEFGHALHGLLSQCKYKGTSGTSVKRDFVEFPSQVNENWAFEPEVLATYAFHYQTGEVIPADLVAKVQAAANFNQGFTTGELCAASILDMKWHELTSVEGVDVESFEAKVCEEMGLIKEIIPRYRSTYFNHIFGSSGYSAGYYSYLWAEVLDKDAFELFKQKGIFDPETAMSLRRNVLEKGGSEEPMTLYRAFRGADPDSGALLRARGLK